MTLEDYVKNNKSRHCQITLRNYSIREARASGLTLQQIAIKFGITRQQVINTLKK